MGSVKDLEVLQEAAGNQAGRGRFVFSDRYSVFDWGEMPDHIPNKGKSLCLVSAYFLESLEKKGVKTHYLGLVEDGKAKRLDQLDAPSGTMEFKLLRVIEPTETEGAFDYSVFNRERTNLLIPLEVIYRNALPPGSSVFKRLKDGSLKLEDIGLEEMPQPGQVLDKALLDFSTKLEPSDRYLSLEEAQRICDLSDDELEKMKETTLAANDLISEEAGRLGLFNEDGKMEFGFDSDRNLMLVDALGTLDECRFTFEGFPVSKEVARIHYRKTDWFKDVEKAKKIDAVNWKSLVESSPPPFPKELLRSISLVYMAYANEITGRELFDAPSLKEPLQIIKDFLQTSDG
jgi:phosphoribosylaminoimidazole-succinocarboxamide synthase